MSDIIAKPVVAEQFWLLHENDQKIGNVLAHRGKYTVKINNEVTEFRTLQSVERAIGVKFQTQDTCNTASTIHGYHTGEPAFNQTWDVQQALPLFTRTQAGQCWHGAGWYRVQRGGKWSTVECPKLIYLQRYPYEGPFLTKSEAENE